MLAPHWRKTTTNDQINEAVARLEGWITDSFRDGHKWISVDGYERLGALGPPPYCNDPALWWPIAERLIRQGYEIHNGPQSHEYGDDDGPWTQWWMRHFRKGDVRPYETTPGRAVCFAYLELNGQPVTEESA